MYSTGLKPFSSSRPPQHSRISPPTSHGVTLCSWRYPLLLTLVADIGQYPVDKQGHVAQHFIVHFAHRRVAKEQSLPCFFSIC